MTYTVKVFLTEAALVELQDSFVDKKDDLQKFVYEQVRGLARVAKLSKIHDSFSANIEEEGTIKIETFNFTKENVLNYKIGHNEKWTPEKLENPSSYSLKIGNKTMDYLELFAQVYLARMDKYNETVNEKDPNRKTKIVPQPDCFEQIIHEQLINSIYTMIQRNIDEAFDKENAEINAPVKETVIAKPSIVVK